MMKKLKVVLLAMSLMFIAGDFRGNPQPTKPGIMTSIAMEASSYQFVIEQSVEYVSAITHEIKALPVSRGTIVDNSVQILVETRWRHRSSILGIRPSNFQLIPAETKFQRALNKVNSGYNLRC